VFCVAQNCVSQVHNENQYDHLASTGHPQWVVVMTQEGHQEFSGLFFEKVENGD